MHTDKTIDTRHPPYRREIIRNDAQGTVVRITLPPGSRTPFHDHNLPVCGRVVTGTPYHYRATTGYEILSPGSTFAIPPGEFHMVGNHGYASITAVIEDTYPPGTLMMRVDEKALPHPS